MFGPPCVVDSPQLFDECTWLLDASVLCLSLVDTWWCFVRDFFLPHLLFVYFVLFLFQGGNPLATDAKGLVPCEKHIAAGRHEMKRLLEAKAFQGAVNSSRYVFWFTCVIVNSVILSGLFGWLFQMFICSALRFSPGHQHRIIRCEEALVGDQPKSTFVVGPGDVVSRRTSELPSLTTFSAQRTGLTSDLTSRFPQGLYPPPQPSPPLPLPLSRGITFASNVNQLCICSRQLRLPI